MKSPLRPHSFRYRLRESLIIFLGRLPTRLTTVDALTAAQGELAQTRAELGRMAKAAAEARTRLSVTELNLSRLREENDRLRLDNKALEVELNAALAAAPQS
jgi:hypothetical protein